MSNEKALALLTETWILPADRIHSFHQWRQLGHRQKEIWIAVLYLDASYEQFLQQFTIALVGFRESRSFGRA